ncbi:protein kinase domain-containing protein [Halobacillus sp. K22]|uniref:protein kinase domain-containing protein n=1 Tax=Halobacillus sp. K22 TaxID=3457431 RepID=UPI003FCDA9E1
MKKQDFKIFPGTYLQGKWNGHKYKVIRKLGAGACGAVYLCQTSQGEKVALKVGRDSSRMMLEVNMLKKFSKVQGVKLGPAFVDVDDWKAPSLQIFPFYVMEYVEGIPLSHFLRGKSKEWIGICTIQLLTDLEHLHKAGFVFGDLKTDNLLMSNSKVRWIDVGGVTAIGRAIKEYTEFYDRGYWGFGSRKAEPSYDLFAVTMIMLEMVYPSKFEKGSHPKKMLAVKLASSNDLKPYHSFIAEVWKGKYQNASEMKQALSNIVMKRAQRTTVSRKQMKTQKHSSEWGELLALSIVAGVFCGFSIFSFWI